MKNRYAWLLLFAAAMLFRSPAAAQEVTLSDDLLFRMGSALQSEGEYYRAITEYKKLLIVFPESERAEDACFNIGMSYLKGEEYESAVAAFASCRQTYRDGKHVAQGQLYAGLSYRKLKRYPEALAQFDSILAQDNRAEEAPQALVGKSLVALETNELDAMDASLARILREYPQHDLAHRAERSLLLAQSLRELPQKSTVLAGSMSALLPGSGYVYAGNSGDGLMAFFVNALFIAGTATAIHQQNYPVACIVGSFGLPFYVGNIYGSANAARKWNFTLRHDVEGRIYSLLEIHY